MGMKLYKLLIYWGVAVIVGLLILANVYGYESKDISDETIFEFVQTYFVNDTSDCYWVGYHIADCSEQDMPTMIKMDGEDFEEFIAVLAYHRYQLLIINSAWTWDEAHEWWIDQTLGIIGIFWEATPNAVYIKMVGPVWEIQSTTAHEMCHYMQYHCSGVMDIELYEGHMIAEAEAENMEREFIKEFYGGSNDV